MPLPDSRYPRYTVAARAARVNQGYFMIDPIWTCYRQRLVILGLLSQVGNVADSRQRPAIAFFPIKWILAAASATRLFACSDYSRLPVLAGFCYGATTMRSQRQLI